MYPYVEQRRLYRFVCVRALKGKRLEQSTPNLLHIVYGRPSAFTDPEVKGSKVKVAGL